MNAADPTRLTPRERLERLEDTSPLRPPLVRSPYFLTAIGLLLMILAIVAVGVMMGFGLVEVFRPYGDLARDALFGGS